MGEGFLALLGGGPDLVERLQGLSCGGQRLARLSSRQVEHGPAEGVGRTLLYVGRGGHLRIVAKTIPAVLTGAGAH